MIELENSIKKDVLEKENVKKEPVKLDEIVKLLFEVSNDLLIPTLNSLFREDFDIENIEIGKTSTEIITDNLDILNADINIKITELKPKHYHIEIQTEVDIDMGFRSFRYDILKAMSNYVEEGKKTGRAMMPKSVIIQIKSNSKITDNYGCFELEMADGIMVKYSARVIEYSKYNQEKLLQENLFILLPLQIFMLRDKLDKITKSGEIAAIKQAILEAKKLAEDIAAEINRLHRSGKIALYDTEKILIALKALFRHLNNRYNSINGEELSMEVDTMVKTLIDENTRKQLDQTEKELQAERRKTEQTLQAAQAKTIERVKKMLRNGEPIKKIIDYEGISEEEIQDIQKTL